MRNIQDVHRIHKPVFLFIVLLVLSMTLWGLWENHRRDATSLREPSPTEEMSTAPPAKEGWRELPERHYDDDEFIFELKNRLLPKEIREIENRHDGLAREEKYLLKMLRENPDNMEYLYLMAYNQFDREKYDSARSHFEKILKMDPRQERATEGRVYCHYKKEDYGAARRMAREALETYPDNPRLLHMLAGSFLYGYRDPPRAVNLYRRAIELDPEDPRLWLGLAEAYVEMKTPDASQKAVEVMEETIRRFPDYHIVYILLAEELHLMGRYREALNRLEEAIARDPLYYRGYSIIGEIFRDLGNFPEALKYYQRAEKTNPRYEALIYIKLGRLHREMGNREKAREYFSHAVSIHRGERDTGPNIEVATARVETALLLIDQGDLDEAEKELDQGEKDFPQLEQLGYGRAMLHLARGEFDTAESVLLASRRPDLTENSLEEWEVRYGLARIETARGRESQALAELVKAMDLLPSFRKIPVDRMARKDRYLSGITRLEGYREVREQVEELYKKAVKVKLSRSYVD